jgi:MerR family transcriptional regulator, heat shock protein HspR
MPAEESQHALNDPVMSIGVLAERVNLSVSAVRKYENEGLVIAHRTASGHRLFSHEDIARVRAIQHMIQDLGLNIEAIRRMQALVPCWELLPCTDEMREHCGAFKDDTRPCWSVKGLECAPQGNECRQCAVYRFGSLCTEHMKRLVHEQPGALEDNAAMRELLDRRRRSLKEG